MTTQTETRTMYTTDPNEGLLLETRAEGLAVARRLTGRNHFMLRSCWSGDGQTLRGYLLVETKREVWGLMSGRRQVRDNPTGRYLKSLS